MRINSCKIRHGMRLRQILYVVSTWYSSRMSNLVENGIGKDLKRGSRSKVGS